MTNHSDMSRTDLPGSSGAEDEPLQIFQNLPAVEFDAGELADMKRSVRELLRSKAIDAEASAELPRPPSKRPSRLERPNRSRRSLWRSARRAPAALRAASASAVHSSTRSSTLGFAAALAAVILTASLLVPSFAPRPLQVAEGPVAAYSPSHVELAAVEALPLVENLGSDTELIQIEDNEMSLVVAAIQ